MEQRPEILLDEVRQSFASVVWTHKIQEKQADIYASEYKYCKIISIFTNAITSCGIITLFFCDSDIAKFFTALISFATLFFNTYLKIFDQKKLEYQHRVTANKFIIVRNQLFRIITKLHLGIELNQIILEYQEIMHNLEQLYLDAPSTTDNAVNKARKALNLKNEYTYTDEEIDHFLPAHLKGGLK